jgi:hypothetical protein
VRVKWQNDRADHHAMSDAPVAPGYWQASDGRWYAPELHPGNWRPPSTTPPSETKALVWTVLAALWLWLLLPFAIYYTRQARREAESSNGMYVWSSRNPLHHPVLLWLAVTFLSVGLIFAMAAVGMYGP